MQTAQKKLKAMADSFSKIGGKLTAAVTLPMVALGAAVVKTSANFEQSILRFRSVAFGLSPSAEGRQR
ncbi:MAG: hypothetical protein RR062_06075 [Clostridia bacterium]